MTVRFMLCEIDAEPGEYGSLELPATVTDATHGSEYAPFVPCVMTFVPDARVSV